MKKIMIATALIASLAGTTAIAGSRHYSTHDRGQSFRDTARVTHVEPIYREVTTSRPIRECYEEEVYHPVRNDRDHNNIAGAVIGGVLGGALGHNMSRHNREPAKVAGAVIGAVIGNEVARKNHRGKHGYYRDYEERCHTVSQRETSRRIDGYRVTYRYKGQTYTTRMDHDPGDRIKVRVSVTPVK